MNKELKKEELVELSRQYFQDNPKENELLVTTHDGQFFLKSRECYATQNARQGKSSVVVITREEAGEVKPKNSKPETPAQPVADQKKAPAKPKATSKAKKATPAAETTPNKEAK